MHLNEREDIELSVLYKKYINQLYAYALSFGFSPEYCLDAIHDVFCNLFVKKGTYAIDNMQYYLFRSLKNRLIDIQRSKREYQSIDCNTDFYIEASFIDQMVDDEEQKLLKKRVESLLMVLTKRQREAIYLRYMLEMEYEEIASLLDMNPTSVRILVSRGIEKLRNRNINMLEMIILTSMLMKKNI